MSDKTREEKQMASCSCAESSPACCPSTDGNEASCCTPGFASRNRRKALISAIVLMAAIGVGAHSLVRGTSAQSYTAGPVKSFSASLTEVPVVGASNSPANIEEISLNRVLESLQALETLAADKDVVFLVLSGEAPSPHQKALDRVEGVAKNLRASGQKVGLFTLKSSTPDHSQLIRHFAVKSLPCVVVLGRQGGASAVEGDISEARLYGAFASASKPGACCPGQSNAACCPK
jgi:hypothetical protein